MSKIFAKYFPLFDHLYILQLFEYNYWDFLNWFVKYPFKRNLQKKHKLQLTEKAIFLGLLSFFWMIFFALIISHFLYKGFYAFLIPFAWLALLQITPLPILFAVVTILPSDYYLKKRILIKTKQKLDKLKNLKVVAITGSYGKTSTKDILYTLLWKKFRVVKTPKSFNTPLGIAQTILEDVKENTDILIAEIGAYKKGEIANIAKLIKPSIGIITAIGPQHLDRFGSLENIKKAKFELVENLSNGKIAILNPPHFDIPIPLIGEHHARNFDFAAAAAIKLGMTLKEIRERAKLLLPTPHRMEIKKIGNITLIDNSYNTNPKSAQSSLELLASFHGFTKVVITPGFVELGKEAAKKNREFGKNIGKLADKVIIVGENAKKDLLKGLRDVNYLRENAFMVNSTQEALILAQQLGFPLVALLENDLPDQYF